MTNMTADKSRPVKIPAGGLTTEVLRLAGYTNYAGGSTAFTCYKGAVMMCDVSDTDGYFAPKQSGINAASGDIFGGVAAEHQAVGSGNTADGSKLITVYKNGVWGFAKGGIAITDIGAVAYASDDDTITTTSSNAIAIGVIQDVDDTYVWVDISDYFMKPI